MKRLLQDVVSHGPLAGLFSRFADPPPPPATDEPRLSAPGDSSVDPGDDVIVTIAASIFRGGEQLPDIPGQLHLLGSTLHFVPDPVEFQPLAVPLLSHIHHHTMPHPELMESGSDLTDADALFLLAIVFLDDREKLESAQTVYFSGRNDDIERLAELVGDVAAAEQAANGWTPPSVNDLPLLPPPAEIQEIGRRRRFAPQAVTHVAVIGGPSKILEPPHILELRKRLPRRNRNGDWRLLFQLSVDGCSYQTMYDRIGQAWPLVLALRTDIGDRIGAFLSSELKVSREYLGRPDCFVWRIRDEMEIFGGSGPPANRFFVACAADEIIVGGGDGAAIMIGDMFVSGRSQPCATYGSPMLTLKERFKIIDVEIWVVMKADTS
jgi:hypothetical protein